MLLTTRTDLSVHVIHLDHQTRGQESAADAEFVAALAERHGLPSTITRRSCLEPDMQTLPANLSARYRAIRFELFRRTAREHHLEGVILAHHADDQAETILHRLVRGSPAWGLVGMSERTRIGDLLVLRPLLRINRTALREYLHSIDQSWREDSSNFSRKYLRNRLRPILASDPELRGALLDLGDACRELRGWARSAAPRLPEEFPAAQLAKLPDILARQSARRWLADGGVPPRGISDRVIARLLEMANDAASPPRVQFPGAVLVHRRGGMLSITRGK
jgi:tRNA(Ile)-lysidine synthase